MINEIMKKMDCINYGWTDKEGNIYQNNDEFSEKFVFQSPEEVIESKTGICWEQVELERLYFEEENIEIETYFIVYYNNNCPSHAFLIYEEKNKYYWFEHSWEIYKGIHEYNSKDELLRDVRDKFIKIEISSQYDSKNLCIYKYNKPKYGISCIEFYKHCESGENITNI